MKHSRLALASISLMVSMESAFATGGGGSLAPVQSTLQTLVQTLTGPIATSLAILAVIGLGLMALGGYLTWRVAGMVICGIVLIFGSTQIVNFFQSAVGN